MTRRMVLYEAGKLLLLLAELACVALIGFATARILWFAIQYVLSAFSPELLNSIADGLPERVAFAGKYIRVFVTGMTGSEAIRHLIRQALILAAGLGGLTLARLGMRRLERSFKQRYMPEVLEQPNGEALAVMHLDDELGSLVTIEYTCPSARQAAFLTKAFPGKADKLYQLITETLTAKENTDENTP